MGVISNIFGFVLNHIYLLVQNYGLAIILFSVLLKIVLLPLSINEQVTRRKTAKIQGQAREIEKKYKNDPQRKHQEVMALWKREKFNPLLGCMGPLVQMVLILAIFFLVRNPLTYMRNIDAYEIEEFREVVIAAEGEDFIDGRFAEVSLVRYARSQGYTDSPFYINMDFLGLDLSNVPSEDWANPAVHIIPGLVVLATSVSMKLTMSMNQKKQVNKEIVLDKDGNPEKQEPDLTQQMSRNMMWMMPIMMIIVCFNAPLGLSLYWLLNSILMITVILILNKVLFSKEDKEEIEGGEENG